MPSPRFGVSFTPLTVRNPRCDAVGTGFLPADHPRATKSQSNDCFPAGQDQNRPAAAVGYQTWRVKMGFITPEEGKRAPFEVGTEWMAGIWTHLPSVLAIVTLAVFILYFASRCRSES